MVLFGLLGCPKRKECGLYDKLAHDCNSVWFPDWHRCGKFRKLNEELEK
jgi:hypothetical protein